MTSSKQGTNCVFEWTVDKRNCDFQDPKQHSGSTTVPCNQQTKLTFYCDQEDVCAGYELTLIGDPCPTPPPNGPS